MVPFLFSAVNPGSAAFMPMADQRASLLTAGGTLRFSGCGVYGDAAQGGSSVSPRGIICWNCFHSLLCSAHPLHYPWAGTGGSSCRHGLWGAVLLQPWVMVSKMTEAPGVALCLAGSPALPTRTFPQLVEAEGWCDPTWLANGNGCTEQSPNSTTRS